MEEIRLALKSNYTWCNIYWPFETFLRTYSNGQLIQYSDFWLENLQQGQLVYPTESEQGSKMSNFLHKDQDTCIRTQKKYV